MLKGLLTILLAGSAILFPGGSNDGILHLNFLWNGIKVISTGEKESLNTIDLQGASYLTDFYYLPGFEIKNVEGKIESCEITQWIGDTLTLLEQKIFDRLYQSDIDPIMIKNKNEEGRFSSDLLIFPFALDTIENRVYKITSLQLKYSKAPTSEPKLTTSRKAANEGGTILSTGDWYKIAVVENAVYKIDKSFLENLGMNINTIDPRKLKIFGNGGGMLPQKNDDARPTDLLENAIAVEGENDGKFDNSDFILFYGQNPHKISHDPETGEVIYKHNIYSDTTYYFLTASEADGKRVEALENEGNQFPLIDRFNQLRFHEQNHVNILKSGREWYGELFNGASVKDFDFDIEGAIPGSTLHVETSVLGQSYGQSSMEVIVNNEKTGEISLSPIIDSRYSLKGIERAESFSYTLKDNENAQANIRLKYNPAPGLRSVALLNYITLTYERKLLLNGENINFHSLKSLENTKSTFRLDGMSSLHSIWDVTDPFEPKAQAFSLSGNTGTFGTTTEVLKQFVAFNTQTVGKPLMVGKIENQNLRSQPLPDLIIVSYDDFLPAAERLASHRETYSGLSVLVTTPTKIYNEFSSGAQDVTAIRDFAKYFYDKGNGDKLKNILLLGKCSYDYKNRTPANTNFVPSYSSRNSTDPIQSYSSDDYYGFLEDGKGEWAENYSGDHVLDIGVGRLPVTTLEEAYVVVDKLIYYDTNPSSFGEWRNQITYIAEDGDGNIHQKHAELLSTFADTTYRRFNMNKVYVDAFPYIKSAAGQTAPKVNEAINNVVNKGSLIVNYTGHGSETRWAKKTILDINMINKWSNLDHLPLFVTATCEFGKHDNPNITSGAEYLLLNPNGGAIGLITTSRPVYSNTNYEINLAFYQNLFVPDEQLHDLGTMFKNTKNGSLSGTNNRNFSLLGDPSMTLAFAKNNIEIAAETAGVKSPGDTINALELVKLKGTVKDLNNQEMPHFNGTLTATVYDKLSHLKTLGNNGAPFEYTSRNSIIFKGDVRVKDGTFNIQFVVPKSISYTLEKGKISLYAKSEDLKVDAAGSDLTFTIGGSGPFSPDDTPPEIIPYINDTSFKEKGITGENIIALAKIIDDNGINILNDDLNQGIIIRMDDGDFQYAGDFFKNELDSYKSGWLRYPFSELEEGHHTVVIGAYDTHNNYSESNIEFYVSNSEKFIISDLFNYPNPFSDKTTFTFEHNRAGEDLEYQLVIIDMNGKKVFSSERVTFSSPARIDDIEWNGESSSGKKLEPGMYVYVLSVRSLKDSSNNTVSNKLLIIN